MTDGPVYFLPLLKHQLWKPPRDTGRFVAGLLLQSVSQELHTFRRAGSHYAYEGRVREDVKIKSWKSMMRILSSCKGGETITLI